MSFVGDKKRVEYMLEDNSRAFPDAGNMLLGPKYEKLVAKSLSPKNRSKELFGSTKKSRNLQRKELKGSPFKKATYLEAQETGREGFSTTIPYRRTRKR